MPVAGVSALVADARANTPLHVAAVAGHVDVCRALLEMVAQSCCVLARAHAAQWRCQERVFFAGGFLDENPLARATIANSLKSLGSPAHFLRHSDFLGALGATAHALDHDHSMKLEMKTPDVQRMKGASSPNEK